MKLSEEQKEEIRKYCKEHITNYEHKCAIVFEEMDEMRCPIEQCSTTLADDLWYYFEEWCNDHKIDAYEVEVELDELL